MPYEIDPYKIAQLRQAYLERYGSPPFLGDYDISYIVNGKLSAAKSEADLTALVLPAMHAYAKERAGRIEDRAVWK